MFANHQGAGGRSGRRPSVQFQLMRRIIRLSLSQRLRRNWRRAPRYSPHRDSGGGSHRWNANGAYREKRGWLNVIGRTPLRLFDVQRDRPRFFSGIRFVSEDFREDSIRSRMSAAAFLRGWCSCASHRAGGEACQDLFDRRQCGAVHHECFVHGRRLLTSVRTGPDGFRKSGVPLAARSIRSVARANAVVGTTAMRRSEPTWELEMRLRKKRGGVVRRRFSAGWWRRIPPGTRVGTKDDELTMTAQNAGARAWLAISAGSMAAFSAAVHRSARNFGGHEGRSAITVILTLGAGSLKERHFQTPSFPRFGNRRSLGF